MTEIPRSITTRGPFEGHKLDTSSLTEPIVYKGSRYFYREVFYAAFGFGPYPCYFCFQPVRFGETVVHHLNEDRSCNHPYNLVPAHSGCHSKWHGGRRGYINKNRPHDPAFVMSAEQKAKISAAHKGVPKSPEHRAKLSAAAKRRWVREKAEREAEKNAA